MDEQTGRELRILRERAYGPYADIHDDSLAIRRLHELESYPAQAAEPLLEGESLPPAEGDVDASVHEHPTLRAGANISRRFRVLWLSSVLVAVLFGGLLSWLIIETSGNPGRPVAVLAVDTAGRWDEGLIGRGSLAFEEFHGVQLIVQPANPRSPLGWCLTAVPATIFDANVSAGPGGMSVGCGAGPFPPTAQFSVTEQAPEELKDAFEPGSTLQFVFDESNEQVTVLLAK